MTPIQIEHLNEIWEQANTAPDEADDTPIERGTGADLIALAAYQRQN